MNKLEDIKYICGWCGHPCKEDGTPWEQIPDDFDPSTIDYKNIQGSCCEDQEENQRIQITKEMAMDAEEPEMEGMWIDW